MKKSFLMPLLTLCGLVGCAQPPPEPKPLFPTAQMTVGGQDFTVEEATTDTEIEIGLTGRDTLPADRALLIAYHSPNEHAVSGNGVPFPIEAVFLDHFGKIVGIVAVPAEKDGDSQEFDSQFILELNQPVASKLALKVGDQLQLPSNVLLPPLPTTTMKISGRTFTVEIATTEAEQELGLMCRPSLPPDRGMIFIFPTESPAAFWNHDVNFPLDVIFMDHGGQIEGIRHMDAHSDVNTPQFNTQYVLELNAGMAKELHLHVGDVLRLPDDVLRP